MKNISRRNSKFDPKTIFLIDGLGALLTATLLMAVVSTFNEYFGMPQAVLPILATVAFVFSIYSISCYLFFYNRSKKLLLPIIIANLSYCVFTLALVIYFYDRLTILGVTYFLGEILLVCGLVCIEWKTLKAFENN